jgi:hypothetical protein
MTDDDLFQTISELVMCHSPSGVANCSRRFAAAKPSLSLALEALAAECLEGACRSERAESNRSGCARDDC